MKIRIYQVDNDRDEKLVKFMNLERTARILGHDGLDSSIYNKVFDGAVETNHLEGVYRIFNTAHPADHKGHSLSVSDVVEITEGEGDTKPGFYFCDSVGFTEVSFDPAKTQEVESIRVVLLEPGKEARIADMGTKLALMQRAVGGYIEAVSPFMDNARLICNEEGKLEGLPFNRALRSDDPSIPVQDYIAGTAFICGEKDGEFISLTHVQMQKYLELFHLPERVVGPAEHPRVERYEPEKPISSLNSRISDADKERAGQSVDETTRSAPER